MDKYPEVMRLIQAGIKVKPAEVLETVRHLKKGKTTTKENEEEKARQRLNLLTSNEK